MRIKEKLPWTIDSPSIHLVQPSDRVPAIHEVVSRQPSVSEDDTILFTLADQEWKVPKTLKKGRSQSNIEVGEKKEAALKCGYISPTIHWQFQPRRSSSFDLRIGLKPGKEKPAVHKTNSDSSSVKSNGTESSRKSFTNFSDILKELQIDATSRTNSETESCGGKTPTSERKFQTRSCETITRGNSIDSTDSNEVFYDIELNTENIVEEEEDDEEARVKRPARKCFSEETFEQNRKLALQQKRNEILRNEAKRLRTISSDSCDDWCEEMWKKIHPRDTRKVSQMVDELLLEIYGEKTCMLARRRSCIGRLRHSSVNEWLESCEDDSTPSEEWRKRMLYKKDLAELRELVRSLQTEIKRFGARLVRHLKRRDCFAAKRELHCDWITAYLQAHSEKRCEDTRTRFSITPAAGDSGFTQWVSGMRMVARLPEGIPQQFRKTLWLNLAEKHLASRGVNWKEVEEFCFNEYTNPDDEELGVQIVKDVHRTGCSLFCGTSGQHNQALLKRVLLAYARWNKAVGYCQGFNMLAALILQVMDKSQVDSVKVMIFLIEGVLPESYFANNLRGLSVDMAVFRDLLRLKLPSLSKHLEQLQTDSKDSGTSYEPPLTNVFTMQWFLTLFCNCLPQETVLRVWDLIFLEGNQILLCTALSIWNTLSDRIMSVESADEFYSIMGVLTREMLEFGLMDANNLVKAIVSVNFPELGEMRERYLYNITPWTQSVSTVARRGLRLFYSDDDTDNEEEDEKIAVATAYGLFRSPKKKESIASGVMSPPKTVSNFGAHPDREKIAMDISALKKQYCKLRERQRQAHIILTAACGGQTLVGPTTSPAMNHLLLGKCALVNNKGRRLGPPQGSIPPPSKSKATPSEDKTNSKSGETLHWKDTAGETLHWKDTAEAHKRQQSNESKSSVCTSTPSSRRGSSSSTSTELCDDPQRMSDSEDQTTSLSEHDVASDTFQEDLKPVVTTHVKETTISNVQEKDDYEIFKEAAAKSRRKSSFKIDLQEMKELDRKLSLKISEIERASFERKRSLIGKSPNQGNIDSQVLFPFDRDYIKEEFSHPSSDTEEVQPDLNSHRENEPVPESLPSNEYIQSSIDFIEQEKLFYFIMSYDTNTGTSVVPRTNLEGVITSEEFKEEHVETVPFLTYSPNSSSKDGKSSVEEESLTESNSKLNLLCELPQNEEQVQIELEHIDINDNEDSLTEENVVYNCTLHGTDNSENTGGIIPENEYGSDGFLLPLTAEYKSSTLTLEEEKVKHHTSRRGSEIALSLILEENSQLLSKFQQSKKCNKLDEVRRDEEESVPETNCYKDSECQNLSSNNEEKLQNFFYCSSLLTDTSLLEINYQHSNTKTKVTYNDFTSDFLHYTSETNSHNKNITKLKDEDTRFKLYEGEVECKNKVKETIKNNDIINDVEGIIEEYGPLTQVSDKNQITIKEENTCSTGLFDNSTNEIICDLNVKKGNTFGNLDSPEILLLDNGKSSFVERDEDEFGLGCSSYNPSNKFFNRQNSLDYSPKSKISRYSNEKRMSLSLDSGKSCTEDTRKVGPSYETDSNIFSNFKFYSPVLNEFKSEIGKSDDSETENCIAEDKHLKSLEFLNSLKKCNRGGVAESANDKVWSGSEEKIRDEFVYSDFKIRDAKCFSDNEIVAIGSCKNKAGITDFKLWSGSEGKPRDDYSCSDFKITDIKCVSNDKIDPTRKCKDEAGATDCVDLRLCSGRERLTGEYFDFKITDTKSVNDIKSEKCFKSTFSFDIDTKEKEFKPRYSSLSPRRKNFSEIDTEPSYLSTPSLDRLRSPSPSKLSTLNFTSALSETDEKLRASSQRLSALKQGKETEFSKQNSDVKYECGVDKKLITVNHVSGSISELKGKTGDSESQPASSPTSPTRFSPFPPRNMSRHPKELGIKLGLYLPPKSDKSPCKRFS